MSNFYELIGGPGRICAHRGARSVAPENTLLALEKARSCGADLWETDVQLSADGELILFHDPTLERTTDISQLPEYKDRKPWKLTEFSWPELTKLNAGNWFLQTDPFGTLAAGEVPAEDLTKIASQKIPRLREALEYCRDFKFPMNLEIKAQAGTSADKVIVEKIMRLLQQTETQSLILISSFKHEYLVQAKEIDSTVATAALVDRRHPRHLLDYLHRLQVDAYHPDQKIINGAQIRQLVDAGMRVNLWTVNDVARARELKAAGAGFICSDWPQRLQDI